MHIQPFWILEIGQMFIHLHDKMLDHFVFHTVNTKCVIFTFDFQMTAKLYSQNSIRSSADQD